MMFAKRYVPFVLLLVLGACTTSFGTDVSADARTSKNASFVLGVILPLTGSGSDQGLWSREGFDLAQEEFAKKGVFVTLVYQDSKGGSPAEAIAGYRAILQEKAMPAFFTWGSGVGVALTSLVNQDRVVQMGVATATPKYSTKDDFTYRVFPSATVEGLFNAQFAFKQGFRTVAVAYIGNDYGQGEKDSFIVEFQRLGGRILATEELAPATTDTRSNILKLTHQQPDLIFLAAYPQEGVLFLKQLTETNARVSVLASTAILSPTFYSGPSQGVFVTQQKFDLNRASTRAFVAAYQATYGVQPNQPNMYTARAYDAFMIVASLLQKCAEKNSECLRQQLKFMPAYEGASDTILFNEYGDLARVAFEVGIVDQGTFVVVD